MALEFLLLGLLASPVPPGGAGAPGSESTELFAVRAKELWLGDGKRVEDGVLLVEGGKIRAAGRGVDVPQGTPVLDHDGVVTAGMIAFDSALGLSGETSEPKRSVLADGRVVDAFDPRDEDVAAALREGITALVLAPSPTTLAGGKSAVIKTAHRTVLADQAHLALSLSDAALDADRYPTSRSGAMAELERLLAQGEGPFGAASAGRLPVLIEAPGRDDVARALAVAQKASLKGALTGARRAGELAEAIATSGLAVVVGPFPSAVARRELDSVVALGAARVPLAFALEAPLAHAATLRLSAAMCVRAGLSPLDAWTALTSGAARTAGVAARVGRLERGLDADFVLWSGDPLDLSSRPVAVFVDGVRVAQGGAR